MTLGVLDFYTKGQMSVNRAFSTLVSDVLFYILIQHNGKIRELDIRATKHYRFDRGINSKDFIFQKLQEYNVLIDLLVHAKDRAQEKWKLNDEEYKELLFNLYLCLIKNYARCGFFKKIVLLVKGALSMGIPRKKKGVR